MSSKQVLTDPDIHALAAKLNMRLWVRSGELWAEDVQLTFRKIIQAGFTRDMNDAERRSVARKILKEIEAARITQGSLASRIAVLVKRAEVELASESDFRFQYWTVVRQKNLDQVSGFCGGNKYSLHISLHDKPDIRPKGEGRTPAEALEKLKMAVTPHLEHAAAGGA